MNIAETIQSPSFQGHIKVWELSQDAKEKNLKVDQPNLITYQGSDVLALALAGEQNSKVSHMYIGFHNGATPPSVPTPDKTDTKSDFDGLSGNYNYIRVPLSLDASYFNNINYANNNVVFSVSITGSEVALGGGAAFTPNSSYIYEAALVCERNSGDISQDLVFSRANFTPILFVSDYNLTVSWAIQFLS